LFKKILIANRGEIACRVMRTAARMGIGTVAVYSEADAGALHVEMADEAVLIGPAASAQSYLVADNILRAVQETGAEAVHPGYGFLSENAGFAKALEAAGVAFIGPAPHAIGAMGDKIESKILAIKAGVPTVPGHAGVIADADAAVAAAREIGYPVMLKASAGGGGKGMRIARGDDEVAEGFRAAASEARSSFGDDRIFVEKFVENPRHIEIQVLADGQGNAIYLGERECSIQRRHQKVIEEAPSPFLDEKTRAAMGESAVALAKAVDYRSAGTVEYIVDSDRNFYFLEMNTRLQVEHPVTECVTGIDLVEQMIRIAAGEKLSIRQKDVKLTGWAMEVRVYAEDPFREFLPSTGRLVRYRPPAEGDGVRVDCGVREGGEISIYYDPMIAKLITYGDTRAAAIEKMRGALDAYYIRGVSHNVPFLAALMAHPRFAAGRLTTGFIAEEYPDGFSEECLVHDDPRLIVAVAAAIHHRVTRRTAAIGGGRPMPTDTGLIAVMGLEERKEFPLTVIETDTGVSVMVDDRTFAVQGTWRPGNPLFDGAVDGKRVCIQVDREGVRYRLSHAGGASDILIARKKVVELNRLMLHKPPPDLSRFLLSPMPGLLLSLNCAEGDTVKAGETLAIVEAMKMENVLRATSDGTVKTVLAKAGASLMVDQPILEFE
jgi:propionyl-CoA carboxylase alpha chain